MDRIHLPEVDDLDPAQRQVYDQIVAGPRGKLVGPLRAAIYRPELARAWAEFGAHLRFGSSLPKKLNELAIITTARRWNAQVEFFVHSEAANEAGLAPAIVEAVRHGVYPSLLDEAEREVFEFVCTLHMRGNVTDHQYLAIKKRWGEIGVVELTAVIGYYTMVSMTLNAHEIPLPDGTAVPLQLSDDGGLYPLPDATAEIAD